MINATELFNSNNETNDEYCSMLQYLCDNINEINAIMLELLIRRNVSLRSLQGKNLKKNICTKKT